MSRVVVCSYSAVMACTFPIAVAWVSPNIVAWVSMFPGSIPRSFFKRILMACYRETLRLKSRRLERFKPWWLEMLVWIGTFIFKSFFSPILIKSSDALQGYSQFLFHSVHWVDYSLVLVFQFFSELFRLVMVPGQNFLTWVGSDQFFVARVGSGRVSHL